MLERVRSGRGSVPLQGSERFVARRRLRRRRILLAFLFLFILAVGGFIYALWQPFFRIARVQVFGATDSTQTRAEALVLRDLEGSYLHILPRDSIFLYPESRVRNDLLALDQSFAAISFFRSNFTTLSIRIDTRVAIARWCGLVPTPGVDEYCYVFDASGLIYAPYASSTNTVNNFSLYTLPESTTTDPLGQTFTDAAKLPATFDLARQIGALGSPVTTIVIKESEVNDYLVSGTRITYVLGDEQAAYTSLASAKGNIDLVSGAVEYVDLRFDGKVYVKKR